MTELEPICLRCKHFIPKSDLDVSFILERTKSEAEKEITELILADSIGKCKKQSNQNWNVFCRSSCHECKDFEE